MTRGSTRASVEKWLDQFSESIRAQDFAAAESLFDRAVFSFGTVAEVAKGIGALRSRQWEKVWPVTTHFRFLKRDLRILVSPDHRMASVNVRWSSRSLATPLATRTGRATIVLRRKTLDLPWQAVHSHFSLSPRDANVATR